MLRGKPEGIEPVFQYDTPCSHGYTVKRMIKGASNRRITEGEAMPRILLFIRFRQFSVDSVVMF
jgi:hypothetical protein